MTADARQITCPLCPETFEVPEVQHAPGVAAVFGLSAETLGQIHLDQEKRRLEADLDQHLRTHPPTDWLPALTTARRERDTARQALAALSLTDYELHVLDQAKAGG